MTAQEQTLASIRLSVSKMEAKGKLDDPQIGEVSLVHSGMLLNELPGHLKDAHECRHLEASAIL